MRIGMFWLYFPWLGAASARVLIRKQSCMQRSCVSLCEVVSACGLNHLANIFGGLLITFTRSKTVMAPRGDGRGRKREVLIENV
uniref:Secreted protein n=1 Tax=Physcomitrium patens TaxID=3218 RepID=A0A7I4D5D6_PHYPA